MTKSPNSQSVINIVLPRELWEPIQQVRTQYVKDARCGIIFYSFLKLKLISLLLFVSFLGPHFSLVEPFVMPVHYKEASKLLREALCKVQPFDITLEYFDFIAHAKSSSLILSGAHEQIRNLVKEILLVFPQCSDLLCRAGGNSLRGRWEAENFLPHVTLRKYGNKLKASRVAYKLNSNWKPITFKLKEIYILHRVAGDPFEVCCCCCCCLLLWLLGGIDFRNNR